MEAIFAIEEAFELEVPFNANDPEGSGFDVSTVEAMARAVQDLTAAKA